MKNSARVPTILCCLSLAAVHASGGAARAAPGGSVRAVLAEGIDANFTGDCARAEAVFRRAAAMDPAHPAPDFYLATVLFWRNSLDPSNPDDDPAIERLLHASADKAQAWLDSGRDPLEALHHLGLAYTYLGRLEAQRGRFYAGGVHGEKGRVYLERVLESCREPAPEAGHPACRDVHFPLGAYAYFAGRLPGVLQRLNFLWFLPKGTAREGLASLEAALESSELHRLGAASLLARIYARFEPGREARALQLSAGLAERFPDNPVLVLEHADLLNRTGRHRDASALAARVLEKHRLGVRGHDDSAALAARLVQAEALLEQGDPEGAESMLAPLAEAPPGDRHTLTPRIALLRGMAADARGDRAAALALYAQAEDNRDRTRNRQATLAARQLREQPYRPGGDPAGP